MPDTRTQLFKTAVAKAEEERKRPNGRKEGFTNRADVTAPYAFTTVEPFILESPWGDAGPRHDRPLEDGVCGSLKVRWTAETPLLVGGGGKGNTNSFFRLSRQSGDGRLAIPGASLRGMLRSVLEVVTQGRMDLVNRDAHFGVRDFTNPRWLEALPHGEFARRFHGGFLRNDRVKGKAGAKPNTHHGWKLTPCNKFAPRTVDLLAHLGLNSRRADFEAGTVAAKYDILRKSGRPFTACLQVNDADPAASLDAHGATTGYLAFSGADPTGKKSTEVVLYEDDNVPGEVDVDPVIMQRFIFMHTQIARGANEAARGSWHFWFDELASGRVDRIPVFYVCSSGHWQDFKMAGREASWPGKFFLCMSRFAKVPFRFSVGRLIDQTQPGAAKTASLDFVQALFGHVPGQEGADEPEKMLSQAWKSRVAFGFALADSEGRETSSSGITQQPRASFWPYYLRPSATTGTAGAPFDYSNDQSRIAGRKRYPARDGTVPLPAARRGQDDERMVNNLTFRTGSPTAPLTFTGWIRCHNLHPVELGGLLWAILLSSPKSDGMPSGKARHMLGRAKPQGHGQLCAQILTSTLTVNTGEPADTIQHHLNYIETFRGWVKESYIRQSGGNESLAGFEDIPAVAELLAMADPGLGSRVADRLFYPRASPTGDESETIAGYRVIKKNAMEKPVSLPPYPLET